MLNLWQTFVSHHSKAACASACVCVLQGTYNNVDGRYMHPVTVKWTNRFRINNKFFSRLFFLDMKKETVACNAIYMLPVLVWCSSMQVKKKERKQFLRCVYFGSFFYISVQCYHQCLYHFNGFCLFLGKKRKKKS